MATSKKKRAQASRRKKLRPASGLIHRTVKPNTYEKGVRRFVRDLISGRTEKTVTRQYRTALKRYEATQRQAAQLAAKLDRQRKQLVKLGLLTKRVNLAKAPTRYQRGIVQKFTDIFTGKATVVHARSEIQARKFKQSYTVKGRAIVVPRQKGERVSFKPSSGELKSTRMFGGKRITKTVAAGQLAPLEPGQYYVIPFANGTRFRTNDLETLINFMTEYEKKPKNPFQDWRKYVEIETIEDEEEGTVALTSHKGAKAIIRRGKKRRK